MCSGFFFCGLPPQSLRDGFQKGRANPLRHGLRRATSPERGRFCSTYRQMPKSSPFGGAGCERSEQTERVIPRRAALSQKAALQMPFSSTTPPVKMQCRSVRRRSGIALLKIIFPLNMARAQAEAIQNRPTHKRQICPPPFLCPQSVVY